MRDFWPQLAERLRRGRRVFVALVVDNGPHSPGTAGAGLLLSDDGEALGTVGGGVMERDILERGRRALARGVVPPEVETLHHRRNASGQRSGMICAGQQTNLYALLGESDLGWLAELLARQAADAPGWLRVTPQGFAVVDALIGAGDAPAANPEHRLEWLPAASSAVDDGSSFCYHRDLLVRRRLVIFGGGHCALALARVMGPLGYRVEVCELAGKEPAAALAQHVSRLHRPSDFRHAAEAVRWPELVWAVVMTSDFASDVAALSGALRRPFPFLGVMGSPAKLTEIRLRLEEEGFGEGDLGRLTAPVGLAIGSHTPEEIAISIAAQILALRQPPAR